MRLEGSAQQSAVVTQQKALTPVDGTSTITSAGNKSITRLRKITKHVKNSYTDEIWGMLYGVYD